jgi:carbonic anhydrase
MADSMQSRTVSSGVAQRLVFCEEQSVTDPASSRRRFLIKTLSTALTTAVGSSVLTACGSSDQRAAAAVPVPTGDQALRRLTEGNARFVANQADHSDEGADRRVAVSRAQHPFATVLGCVDSRVPIELVFDQGLGDLVVVRSAGGVLDRSVTGSLEFGVAELGTPLLVVLGHQRCGAVDATIKAVDAEGDINYLINALQPAVRQVAGRPGDRLTNAVHANVDLVLAQLRKSTVISPLEKSGKLKLVGAYYELDTGKVLIG